MKKTLALFLILTGCLVATGWSQPSDEVSEAMYFDAVSYGEMYGIEVEEAIYRLRLQKKIGDLNALLLERERDSFAGLWIEHEPAYRVVVRSTDAFFGERLPTLLHEKSLSSMIEVRPAKYSVAELERIQVLSRYLADEASVPIDSDINVFENRVEVFAVENELLKSNLALKDSALPDGVAVIPVEQLAETQQLVLRGGADITSCTGGFAVRQTGTNGERGISTAAHCSNTQSFSGINLPFRAGDQQGDQDVQWNAAPCTLDVDNQFNSGAGMRACTGTRHRNNQAIGSFVCKFGQTTGRTCGNILSNNYAPSYVFSANATFMRVDGTPTNRLSEGGDSGGPWFVGNLAYGTHSGFPGADRNDALYMAINFIYSIGVQVMTYDPGPRSCNNPPTAFFFWTGLSNAAYFEADASSDPDGDIATYSWDFGDGTGITTTSGTYLHQYQRTGNYRVTLTVTDSTGLTDTATDVVTLGSPGFF